MPVGEQPFGSALSANGAPDSKRVHRGPVRLGRFLEPTTELESKRTPLRVTGPIRSGTTRRLLAALARSRRSGTLSLTDIHSRVELEIGPDRLLVLDAGSPRLRIGALAVAERLLSPQQLLNVLKKQTVEAGEPFLGRLLLQHGVLDDRALRWLLHLQARRILEAITEWKTGFFTFDENRSIDTEARVPVLDPRLHLDRLTRAL